MSLPSKTRKDIINNPELLKELVKSNINERRYKHSLSVADTCVLLAKIHHVDLKKAYYAGLLHDVAKYLTDEETNDYLAIYDNDKINYPKGTLHSFVGKYYLKEKLNYHDKDVLNAIYNHTICNSKDKLSLILYIADKREPLRGINDNILEIAKDDLKLAYKLLNKDVEDYLNTKNERFITDRL